MSATPGGTLMTEVYLPPGEPLCLAGSTHRGGKGYPLRREASRSIKGRAQDPGVPRHRELFSDGPAQTILPMFITFAPRRTGADIAGAPCHPAASDRQLIAPHGSATKRLHVHWDLRAREKAAVLTPRTSRRCRPGRLVDGHKSSAKCQFWNRRASTTG